MCYTYLVLQYLRTTQVNFCVITCDTYLLYIIVMYSLVVITTYLCMVKLANRFTSKREHSHEPCRILRVLVSYWHVHDNCRSAKYVLMSVVYVAAWHTRTSALASHANACHKIAMCARMHEFVFIVIIPLLSCL